MEEAFHYLGKWKGSLFLKINGCLIGSNGKLLLMSMWARFHLYSKTELSSWQSVGLLQPASG